MTRQGAIVALQSKDILDEETEVALNSLIAWNCVIQDLKHKIEFARSCGAKDYAIGLDAALYTVQQHLQDDNIVC